MTTNPTPEPEAVTARLRAASDAYPELPATVAQRLDRALAELPDLTAPDTAPTPEPAAAARRPWWRGGFALASLSLVVVAVLGGGLLFALQPWQGTGGGDTSAAQEKGGDDAQPFSDKNGEKRQEGSGSESEPGVSGEVPPYTLTYSNRDYRAADLARARDVSRPGDPSAVPTQLRQLATDKSARDACVAAAAAEFGGTVSSVDFGRYEGAPAMVVVVTAASGDGGTVAALAPDCSATDPEVLDSVEF